MPNDTPKHAKARQRRRQKAHKRLQRDYARAQRAIEAIPNFETWEDSMSEERAWESPKQKRHRDSTRFHNRAWNTEGQHVMPPKDDQAANSSDPGTCLPPRVTIIVPCYNERFAIGETIADIHRSLKDIHGYELIVVDDGSTDGSRDLLNEMARTDARLRLIEHPSNRGYGAALKTAIREAHAEFLVITDGDGSYPNERIPELLRIAQEADMVVGARTADDVQYPFLRKIPKFFLRSYCSFIAGKSIPDINSGMRVFRRAVVQRFMRILPDGFSFTTTITLAMLTNNCDVRFVEITYMPRIGTSKIRPIYDTLNFFQLILRSATYFAPLRVFLPTAFLLFNGFLISLGYDVLVARNLTDKTLMLLMFSLTTGMFALLADMIDKRGPQL
jgi:glycosyltransferase involved in cell wall biosynthesis